MDALIIGIEVAGSKLDVAHIPNNSAAQPLRKELAEERVVAHLRKDRHTAVAALCDMMRNAGDDDAGEAGHAREAATRQKCVQSSIMSS